MISLRSTIVAGISSGAMLGLVMRARRLTSKIPKLTLHVYDHCPFCVRAELVLGWKGIPFERKVYGYGDTLGDTKGKYYGGKTLTGKKSLPVLEIQGRIPKFMPESGSIIAFAEGLAPLDTMQLVPMNGQRADLKAFFDSKGDFKKHQRILTRPIVITMRTLKDWERDEDIMYATEKYKKSGFEYAKAMKDAAASRVAMNILLVKLDSLMQTDFCLTKTTGGSYSWDDVIALPELRTLSCAKALVWPKKLKAYLTKGLKQANVSSYAEA